MDKSNQVPESNGLWFVDITSPSSSAQEDVNTTTISTQTDGIGQEQGEQSFDSTTEKLQTTDKVTDGTQTANFVTEGTQIDQTFAAESTQTDLMSGELEFELWTLVNKLLHTSYCYLYLAPIFSRDNLTGLARRYYQQEERHLEMARHLVEYLTSRGAAVRLVDVAKPAVSCHTTQAAVKISQQLEEWVVAHLADVQQLAVREVDPASQMLEKMLKEQLDQVEDSDMLVRLVYKK